MSEAKYYDITSPFLPNLNLFTKNKIVSTKLAFLTATNLLLVTFQTFITVNSNTCILKPTKYLQSSFHIFSNIFSTIHFSLHWQKKFPENSGRNILLKIEWNKCTGFRSCRKNKFETWTALHAQGAVVRSQENWSWILIPSWNSSDKKGDLE